MSEAIELKIQKLLIELEDQERVADVLLKDWDQLDVSDEEARSISFFLVNAGFVPSLLDRINQQFERNKRAFWDVYSIILAKVEKQFTGKVISSIAKGIDEDEFSWTHFHHERLEEHFDPLKNSVTEYKASLQRSYEERQRDLIDQIQFLSTQRLIEEERKALALLVYLNPKSEEHQTLNEDFNDRWARHILNLKQSIEKTARLTQKVRDDWNKEMGGCFEPIMDALKKEGEKSPELDIDLSYVAYFMDFTDAAMRLINKDAPSPSRDWLYAELLLENRRYIDLLEWINTLEVRYLDDPDSTFATSYLKAKAFWGLGQATTAIDLLTSIVQVRPNYRSAHSLLQEWQGGAP